MIGSNAPHLLSLIVHELDAADALVSFKTAKVSAEAFAAQLGQQELQVEYREGEADYPIGFVIRICDSRGNRVDLLRAYGHRS